MNNPFASEQKRDNRRVLSPYPLQIIFFSLLAIVSTYLLANSSMEVSAKTRGFSIIIAVFLGVCACLHLWQSRRKTEMAASDGAIDAEVERSLFVLEEANEFFAGSLKSADTFRLVASGVRDLLPFQTIVLFLLDETRSQLKVAEAEGIDAQTQKGRTMNFDVGPAGKCYLSGRIETDDDHLVAIPLLHGIEVYGVLEMHLDSDAAAVDQSLFEAVGTRVAPLILSSISFERSLSNALTDSTTDLPNERAFYLILENQIAESQRKREMRPLSILTIDIRNFDEINQRFGHAAGDRVLNFAAQIIKDNLRQMDFFARAIDDEFLAILPTASKEISHEIMARVHTGFFGRKIKISDTDSVEIDLNIGWAAFGEDGETPDHLLTAARVRKEQNQIGSGKKGSLFPKKKEAKKRLLRQASRCQRGSGVFERFLKLWQIGLDKSFQPSQNRCEFGTR